MARLTEKTHALKVRLRFALKGPLVLKAESVEDYFDHVLDRTPDGRVHINGYVWASLLRRAVGRLREHHGVFTSIGGFREDLHTGVSSFWFEPSFVQVPHRQARPGIRIDRCLGSVQEGALYVVETLPQGVPLEMNFAVFLSPEEVSHADAIVRDIQRALYVIEHSGENIGGNWSYGCGHLRFVEGTCRVLDLRRPEDRAALREPLKNGQPLRVEPAEGFVRPWVRFHVKARIRPGQMLAVHSEEFYSIREYPELPDKFVYRCWVYDPEEAKFKLLPVIPGKALRQALLSVPLERKLRTLGRDICENVSHVCTCSHCNRNRKKGARKPQVRVEGCQCLRCQWFGSTDRGGQVAVTDAIVSSAETVLLRRIQLCEHSMQNINLFLEEYLTKGDFEFDIIVDGPEGPVEEISALLDEMSVMSACPPGWFRLGANTTSAGQVEVLHWQKEVYE